ncbi:DNase I-like protein, partial [Exidia glandulosa HHB12029]
TSGIISHELIAGRALLVTIPWHLTLVLNILVIYGHNDPTAGRKFWSEIAERITELDLPDPDFMIGDFNNVEENIDRLPMRLNDIDAMDTFNDLRAKYELIDGWRTTYPDSKAFTFKQYNGHSQSRLDRIYCTNEMLAGCRNWQIEESGLVTDHKLVSVELVDLKQPFIGKGRPVIPLHIVKDRTLNKVIQEEALKLSDDFERCKHRRSPDYNAQILWQKFKDKIGYLARQRAKLVIPKLEQRIRELKIQLDLLLNDPTLTEDEKALSAAVLQE